MTSSNQDVHTHTCDMPTVDSLRIHFLCTQCPLLSVVGITVCAEILSLYPMPPSLFFLIPSPTGYLAAQIGCSRCAHHLITLKYKQIIVFLQLTLGLRVRVVLGFQSCVRHQTCAPGLQTGTCCTGLVDGSVSQTCSRHRLCAPGLQTCACGTGLADRRLTHALLDVAFSLMTGSRFRSCSLAFFLSRTLAPSLSLSLSHTHTNMLGAIILILMPSDSD